MAESEVFYDCPVHRDKLWEGQECLGFLKRFRPDDLSVTLEKEPGNKFDSNAIRIVVYIHPISKKTIIGYVPKGLARELSKVIDTGVEVKAKLLDIIGGYGHRETLGALVNMRYKNWGGDSVYEIPY